MADLTPITRKERILSGEDIEPVTRLEHFMKNAVSGGGSGSGLPSYTSSDIGKVLTVGQGTETVVVVPEQTVTVSEGPPTSFGVYDVDFFSSATVGAEVSITINGVTSTAVATSQTGLPGLVFAGEHDIPILMYLYEEYEGIAGQALYFNSAPGEYTVSATRNVETSAIPRWLPAFSSDSVYLFDVGTTTPRDIIRALNAGKIVADIFASEDPNAVSGLSILISLSADNGVYTAYFIKINNTDDGVTIHPTAGGGIDDVFSLS